MKIGILMKHMAYLAAAMSCVSFGAPDAVPQVLADAKPNIECAAPGAWRFATKLGEFGDGVCEFAVKLNAPDPAVPPKFCVSFSLPQNGAHHVWTADVRRGGASGIRVDWESLYKSNLAISMPLACAKDCSDRNRLTVAASEAQRDVSYGIRLREEGCVMKVDFEFFRVPEAPRTEYAVKLRIDRRDVFWGDAVRDATDWIRRENSLSVPSAPEAAFEPLYSTWYQFHQDVTADRIEAEAKIAASLGMKTLIVDDGWQTDDTSRGYAFCGDWEVSKRRFPDMAAHVARVKAMGLKYMMWYSVPFVGEKSKNFERFKGKYLKHIPHLHASVLDPRFPEVRRFLADIYECAQREWGLDGFKLDFIDSFSFSGDDPAVRDGYAGRDVRTVPEGVAALLSDVTRRLRANDPNVLIEFRQNYVGPVVTQYGNMIRAADCPGDRQANRVRIADLRLTSGRAAVHADMLEWNPVVSAAEAAGTVLSVIFGTVQYSMMLSDLPPDHIRMIRHWVKFSEEHRRALQQWHFAGHKPEAGYPILEGEDDGERIVGVYCAGMTVSVRDADKPTWILNGTDVQTIYVDCPVSADVKVFDTFGTLIDSSVVQRGISKISVPVAGYIRIGLKNNGKEL